MASEETENGSESTLTITFPSNTNHKPLSTELLAPWLYSNCLTKLKNLLKRSCWIAKFFVSPNNCLPVHNNRPTVLNTGHKASILSQCKVYFCLHEPFLFSCHYLLSLVSRFSAWWIYIATIENCCAPMVVKHTLFAYCC